MTTQYLIDGLFDGVPSDQLKETVGQVNLLLRLKKLSGDDAARLINIAVFVEKSSRYYGIPLENGSPQTLEVELARTKLCTQARK